jgi:hypothetical protein
MSLAREAHLKEKIVSSCRLESRFFLFTCSSLQWPVCITALHPSWFSCCMHFLLRFQDLMAAGAHLNVTEDRAVGHMALRTPRESVSFGRSGDGGVTGMKSSGNGMAGIEWGMGGCGWHLQTCIIVGHLFPLHIMCFLTPLLDSSPLHPLLDSSPLACLLLLLCICSLLFLLFICSLTLLLSIRSLTLLLLLACFFFSACALCFFSSSYAP